ncbi:MAG: helix-turn-helix domain-containing protein [Thomasclavelia sp.]
MSLHDRIIIENSLNNGHSFKTIGSTLDKDCTTISKEVRKKLCSSQHLCCWSHF